MKKLVGFALAVLLSLALLSIPMAWGATSLSLSGVFLGEPDGFIPQLGVGLRWHLARSLTQPAFGRSSTAALAR